MLLKPWDRAGILSFGLKVGAQANPLKTKDKLGNIKINGCTERAIGFAVISTAPPVISEGEIRREADLVNQIEGIWRSGAKNGIEAIILYLYATPTAFRQSRAHAQGGNFDNHCREIRSLKSALALRGIPVKIEVIK